MDIKTLIEKCRRQQQQLPGQIEMDLDTEPEIPWASEAEALAEWRGRTFVPGWVTFPADWIEPA